MIFAFNCVTPVLILVECCRKKYGLFDSYFKTYTTSTRELESNIVTHIYLLMGIALTPTLSFIILDGGFFNSEFTVFSFSGLVFLGVADTVACVYGKNFGSTYWSDTSKKTAEGSGAALFFMTLAQWAVCSYCHEHLVQAFLFIFFANTVVVVVEGLTK